MSFGGKSAKRGDFSRGTGRRGRAQMYLGWMAKAHVQGIVAGCISHACSSCPYRLIREVHPRPMSFIYALLL